MADDKMPEPSNEWEFPARKKPYSKVVEIQLKNFATRLRHSGTMLALENIKRDIMRSALVANMQALQELKGIASTRAVELGFKGSARWWQ